MAGVQLTRSRESVMHTAAKGNFSGVLGSWDAKQRGRELHAWAAELFPICRSITGDGVRQSLKILQRVVPMEIREVPTGTQVFDWTVPKEWNIRDAFIKNRHGERIVDFQKSNLHVVNYSMPVHERMTLEELRPHLHSIPEKPDWVPYRTSYYTESWGFCLSHRKLQSLPEDQYEVVIDSTLEPGHLTYGEFRVAGQMDEEILISTHCCHPSLANDNLSGMVVATKLAQTISGLSPRYSYRFLWLPGTIGAITWLAINEERLKRIKDGLVLSCVGDMGSFTYKRSRLGNAEIDQTVEYVLRQQGPGYELLDFSPLGYDERQFCSAGINLPVGNFTRSPNGRYPEYHSSADDLMLVKADSLAESSRVLLCAIQVLEQNATYINTNPKCEPQLGKRGLYSELGGAKNSLSEEAFLWLLNLSDGEHSLLDIATRSKIPFDVVAKASESLLRHNLLKPSDSAR